MNLHEDKALFAEIVLRASQPVESGGFGINAGFIEKDYWITRSLQQLSKSSAVDYAVFKGGTSLSKIYGIGARFSEDVDVAVVRTADMSDAKLKSTIKTVGKTMSEGLTEIERPGLTSKGSRYRKTYHVYPQIEGILPTGSMLSGQLLIEINSFANPYPFALQKVDSFVLQYLMGSGHNDIIEEYDLSPFDINVLDKRTTLTEKLVSLIRFSLSPNPIVDISSKIRHFYDLYYLMNDPECHEYVHSTQFTNDFMALLNHDREKFDQPEGWNRKSMQDSTLISDWKTAWRKLAQKYSTELPPLAYSAIPPVDAIESKLEDLLKIIGNLE